MEKFTLHHTALYSKGWYKRYNNKTIWQDLQIMLTLDGYSGDLFSNKDILRVILAQCQRINMPAFTDLYSFVNGISENECWKYGYYTKNHTWIKANPKKELPEYDNNEAIVRYCLSNISMLSPNQLSESGKLPRPDYVKGLPRKNGISDKKINELFA